jgi:hypothetical protein
MPLPAATPLLSPGGRVTLTALKWSGISVTPGSFVEAITVRVVAGGAGVVCAEAVAARAIPPSTITPVVLYRMMVSHSTDRASYALPDPFEMASRFRAVGRTSGGDRLSETLRAARTEIKADFYNKIGPSRQRAEGSFRVTAAVVLGKHSSHKRHLYKADLDLCAIGGVKSAAGQVRDWRKAGSSKIAGKIDTHDPNWPRFVTNSHASHARRSVALGGSTCLYSDGMLSH